MSRRGVTGGVAFWRSMRSPTLTARVLPLFALALAACSGADEEVVVQTDAIVGGRLTSTTHLAVGYLAEADADLPFCTATLVDARYIATAAHCLVNTRATTLVWGTGKFSTTARRIAVKRCKRNPLYRDTYPTAKYDFAYCELASPSSIAPMEFIDSPAFDAKHLALGYGQTDPDDYESGGPRKQLAIKRVSAEDEELLEGLEDMLATTSPRGDLCFGDSGSPLLVFGTDGVARVAGVLHGGVTDGDSDCAAGNISLYAPIAANTSFYASR